MRISPRAIFWVALLSAALLIVGCQQLTGEDSSQSSPQSSQEATSSWTPLNGAIDVSRATRTTPFESDEPRRQNMTALRIDLRSDIGFTTSERTQLPALTGQQYATTSSQTVTDFINSDSRILLGVNANFFWPCCSTAGDTPAAESVLGLYVNDGKILSSYGNPAADGTSTNVPNSRYTSPVTLVITKDNTASIQIATNKKPLNADRFPTSDIQVALAGGPNPPGGYPPIKPSKAPDGSTYPNFLLRSGRIQPAPDSNIGARTAVGLSRDKSTLLIVTVDGAADQSPPLGASFNDLAHWLKVAGAHTAFALDGGGSTQLGMRIDGQKPQPAQCPPRAGVLLLNVPHGDDKTACLQRLGGAFFGVTSP
ncbi:MAG: hypothetical protein CMH41_10130 [Micrococcales bacterium]|nr:hypothetical protein [Micrococcales bacterium]